MIWCAAAGLCCGGSEFVCLAGSCRRSGSGLSDMAGFVGERPMELETEAACGAAYRERMPGRHAQRNGDWEMHAERNNRVPSLVEQSVCQGDGLRRPLASRTGFEPVLPP